MLNGGFLLRLARQGRLTSCGRRHWAEVSPRPKRAQRMSLITSKWAGEAPAGTSHAYGRS